MLKLPIGTTVATATIKREFRHFHVVSCNDGKEMYKKRVIHVQNCCFANQTYCFFAVLVAVRVVVA